MQIQVIVSYMRKNKELSHDSFSRNQILYSAGTFADLVKFITIDSVVDPLDIVEKNHASRNVPDYNVRSQTRDIISLLKYIGGLKSGNFYMFMEDDFKLCSNGMEAILNTMHKVFYSISIPVKSGNNFS